MTNKLDAIIFDFNGVIVDDEHLHCRAFMRALGEEGMRLEEREYFDEYLGLDDWGFFGAALESKRGEHPDPKEVDDWVERKSVLYFEELERGFELFPGVDLLITKVAKRLPLAIASGARLVEIEKILDVTGLRDRFTVIVAADDVSHGKPDPEGYLLARQRLHEVLESPLPFEPSRCLVIEDAPPGIEAAHAAGMICLAVTNSTDHDSLNRADGIVDTLESLDLDDLLRLTGR